jgi:hypothetical protein
VTANRWGVAAALVLLACAKSPSAQNGAAREPGPAAATTPDASGGAAHTATAPAAAPVVVLTPPGREPVRVTVEMARTAEERRKGLMYRQNLAPDAGMLFWFEDDEIHSFWMKNTLIPLDMIFIRADGTVAGVVENAEPRTLESRSIGKTSRHVLEVNGGFSRAHGIVEGTRVTYENIPEATK